MPVDSRNERKNITAFYVIVTLVGGEFVCAITYKSDSTNVEPKHTKAKEMCIQRCRDVHILYTYIVQAHARIHTALLY